MKRELSVPAPVARILINRGLSDSASARRFLNPSLDQLLDPFLLTDMTPAVDRIRRALRAGERLMVYGDYDVDGVTGTSVLLRALRRLGGDASFYIPHRTKEGYGISQGGIDEALRRQVGLLISVDCGITAHREVEYARERGVDVIVTDHHQPGPLPRAVAVVNPKREDCPYPFKELPGVALAFKVADALFRGEGGDAQALHEDLDLVALGCAADIVPLVDENRVLVKHGLERMLGTRNVGLRALIENVGLGGKPIGTGQVVFMLAPRINAIGRMGSATEAVEMLTAEDPEAARQIAERLEVQNQIRREADDRTLSEALDMIEREVDLDRDRAVVLASERSICRRF
jgi:single-stranded-DNA-specific exonuclease